MKEYLYLKIENDRYIKVKTKSKHFFSQENLAEETVPHFVFTNNKLANAYAGYRLIQKDLENIIETIDYLLNRATSLNHIVSRALTTFIIITYGKCFCKADGRKIKLEKNIILNLCNSEYEKMLHQNLLILRDQYIAHGGISQFEKNDVAVAFFGDCFSFHDTVLYLNNFNEDYTTLKKLATKVLLFVERKVNSSFEKLGEYISKNFDEIKEKSFIPNHDDFVSIYDL